MSSEESREEQAFPEELSELTELRQFQGAPAEFWAVFVSVSTRLIGAAKGVLILKDSGDEERAQLKKIGEWPKEGSSDPVIQEFMRHWSRLTEECAAKEALVEPIYKADAEGERGFLLAMRMKLEGSTALCVAAYALQGVDRRGAEEALTRVRMAADVPQSYQVARSVQQAREDAQKFATVMDVAVEVNTARRFVGGGMTFCNALATRFECERVSLGWLERGFVRVKAISRTEKFEKQMEAVQQLESAMEECFDQDDEVVWPAPADSNLVTRDHAVYAEARKAEHLCAVPVRDEGEPVGVVLCERNGTPFSEVEVRQLRLACDFSSRVLCDLHRDDRWFGARWASALKERLSWFVGPEHTWAKVLALILTAAVLAMIFVKVSYRVEAEFILRSDETAYLTAPFSGHVSAARVKPGDRVEPGQVLLELDKDDLYLQEAAAIAELNRYNREMEKARAEAKLADMRVAQAQADQSEARLKLVRHRLEQSDLKAPFAGVVVEGDQRQRIGAAVSAGDTLYRIARTDTLYVEAEIEERDIHEALDKVGGEIAFVSQPDKKFPVKISLIESAAVPKEGGNVFLVRCDIDGGVEEWWRPGMSGLCKIDIGPRRLIWIFTHRTVDFFRLWLWW